MTTSIEGKQLVFEDVKIGDEITPLVKGPMSPVHLMRWSAAMENWHRIHYDETFTKEHEQPTRAARERIVEATCDGADDEGLGWTQGLALENQLPVPEDGPSVEYRNRMGARH